MTIATVAQLWTEFSGKVLHPACPAIQHIEMRRAFYAGFYACIKNSVEIADLTATPEDGAVEFEKLDGEGRAFAAAVGRGEA